MKLNFKLIPLLLLLVAIGNGCKKDKCLTDCEKYTSPTAKFGFHELVDWFERTTFEEDTMTGSRVYFKVKDPNVKQVQWKIGTDTSKYTGRTLYLEFRDIYVDLPKTIACTCFVYLPGPDGCDKMQRDTIIRNLVFTENNQSNVYGKWKGKYTDGTGGERIVELKEFDTSFDCSFSTNLYYEGNKIYNLFKGNGPGSKMCMRPVFSNSHNNIRLKPRFENNWDTVSQDVKGYGKYDIHTKEMTINFTYGYANTGFVTKTFIGKRL